MPKSEPLPETASKQLSPTTLRQRRLRDKDKERGINHLKLRITQPENDLLDSVRARMSMTRTEATMFLFHEAAKEHGIKLLDEPPAITSVRMTKDSDAAKLLNELVELSGFSASLVLTKALTSYKQLFV